MPNTFNYTPLSLQGTDQDDTLNDGPLNDTIDGGDGNDVLKSFWGADSLNGGDGDDRLESRSDAGEPAPAQGIAARGTLQGDEDAEGRAHGYFQPTDYDDTLTGGSGADQFYFRGDIDARLNIAAKHINGAGVINWKGVAHENNNTHDHWVESIGNDVITDFNADEGDTIRVEAHTVNLTYEQIDADGDGEVDDTLITLTSNQGGTAADPNGAHDQDPLGTITVLNADVETVKAATTSDAGVFHGAAYTLAELTAQNQVAQGVAVNVTGRSANDTIGGGETDDTINGGAGNDVLHGLGGDDEISGGNNNDQISGGDGNDKLYGQHGQDVIDAGDGDDLVDGGIHNDKIDAGAGDDTVYGGNNNDQISGGDGDDKLYGQHGEDVIDAGDGNDFIDGGIHNDVINAGDGDDTVYGGNNNDQISGGDGNDSLLGGHGQDVIDAGDGNDLVDGGIHNDKIDAGAGDDTVYGGNNNDQISGGDGDDKLYGQHGQDVIDAGDGNDFIDGGIHNDKIDAGAGDDTVYGGNNNDQISGGDGDDQLFGGHGRDLIDAGDGDDVVDGGIHNDTIYGGDGDDQISGGNNNDRLYDGAGNDQLSGDHGNDVLSSFLGADTLDGGIGNDRLESRSDAGEPTPAQTGDANDRVNQDFNPTDTDDVLTGGAGADTFYFRLDINAKEEIAAKHADENGVIDWKGVAHENNDVHDHWVEGIGNDVITDFDASSGDKIVIDGHTVTASYSLIDADGDGAVDDTLITLISNQGGTVDDPNGAHDQDPLGTITVLNAELDAGDVSVNAGVFYGAFETLSDLQDGWL